MVRRRGLALFLMARAVSLLGDEVRPFVLSFAAYGVDGSATSVGVVLAAGVAPQLAVLLVGGWWGDTRSPLRTLICADVARAAVLLAAAVMWFHGVGGIPLLVMAQIGCGIAEAFFVPSAGRLLVSLSPPERLVGANALVGVAGYSGELAGPAIAALLLAVGGPAAGIGFDAMTFAAGALILTCLHIPPPDNDQPSPVARRAAIRAVFAQPVARTVLFVDGVWALLGTAPILVLGPVVCASRLDGPTSWAAIITAYGAGGIVGGLLLTWRAPLRRVATIAFLLEAPAPSLLALPAPTAIIVPAALIGGIGSAATRTILMTLLQHRTPANVQATATALHANIELALLTVGYILIGSIAPKTGASPILLTVAVTATCLLAPIVHRVGQTRTPERTRRGRNGR